MIRSISTQKYYTKYTYCKLTFSMQKRVIERSYVNNLCVNHYNRLPDRLPDRSVCYCVCERSELYLYMYLHTQTHTYTSLSVSLCVCYLIMCKCKSGWDLWTHILILTILLITNFLLIIAHYWSLILFTFYYIVIIMICHWPCSLLLITSDKHWWLRAQSQGGAQK